MHHSWASFPQRKEDEGVVKLVSCLPFSLIVSVEFVSSGPWVDFLKPR